MNVAVIETGGKQYVVEKGDVIRIETLPDAEEGKDVAFDSVLLTANGDDITVGEPTIEKASVAGTVKAIGRGKKVDVRRFKSKSRYHRAYGHRQPYMDVEITKIA